MRETSCPCCQLFISLCIMLKQGIYVKKTFLLFRQQCEKTFTGFLKYLSSNLNDRKRRVENFAGIRVRTKQSWDKLWWILERLLVHEILRRVELVWSCGSHNAPKCQAVQVNARKRCQCWSRDNMLITWLHQIQTKTTRAAGEYELVANRRPETELSFFVLHFVAVFLWRKRRKLSQKRQIVAQGVNYTKRTVE